MDMETKSLSYEVKDILSYSAENTYRAKSKAALHDGDAKYKNLCIELGKIINEMELMLYQLSNKLAEMES